MKGFCCFIKKVLDQLFSLLLGNMSRVSVRIYRIPSTSRPRFDFSEIQDQRPWVPIFQLAGPFLKRQDLAIDKGDYYIATLSNQPIGLQQTWLCHGLILRLAEAINMPTEGMVPTVHQQPQF